MPFPIFKFPKCRFLLGDGVVIEKIGRLLACWLAGFLIEDHWGTLENKTLSFGLEDGYYFKRK
jgi:hypothetical protein